MTNKAVSRSLESNPGTWRTLPRRALLWAAAVGALVSLHAVTGCSDSSSSNGNWGNNNAGGSGGSGSGSGSGTAQWEASYQGINTVWLEIDQSQGRILRVHQAIPEVPASPPPEDPADPFIGWELTSNGKVVTSGKIASPWMVHTDFAEDGTADPKWGEAAGKVQVRINVPDVDGELRFYSGTIAGDGGLSPQGMNKGFWEWFLGLFSSDKKEEPAPTDVPGLKMIVNHGKCPGRVNILLLPDGFTQSELSTFQSAASTFANALKSEPAYGSNWDYINVWTLDVASTDSGISDPDASVTKNTAFGTTFGNGDMRRCIFPRNTPNAEAADLRAKAEAASEANQTVIISNTTEWGGCAGGNVIAQSRHPGGGRVLAHELGHSLFKLADEYDYGTCRDSAGKGEPNTTRDATSPPWKALLNTTELPTTTVSATTIGAYEGAQYCTKGVYRPTFNECIMRDSGKPFCAVCKGEADKVFASVKKQADKDATCGKPLSCFKGGTECGTDRVCSWNGTDKGYCCKTPFTGTKTCFSDDECAPDVCSFGGPPDNFFYCVPKNDPQCP